MRRTGSAPGKIILTGEYAVVFGHPGIAIPSSIDMTAAHEPSDHPVEIVWNGTDGGPGWISYARTIVVQCERRTGVIRGTLTIDNHLPLGKGMGSSTAVIVAVCRALLEDDCRDIAAGIEKETYPNASGLDFAVIWEGRPVRFVKGETPQPILLPQDLLRGAVMIDTGTPNQTTKKLVSWVKEKYDEKDPAVLEAIDTIAGCTKRLESGDDLRGIMKEHHRAQVALGVVPPTVQELIGKIEAQGGTAKVIGAGARTGGGGMVLALPPEGKNLDIPQGYETIAL